MDQQTADDYLRRVIELSREMIELASAGDACRTDAGCGIVFGTLRDKAYKVRKLAESELQRHEGSGDASADASTHAPADASTDDRNQPSPVEDTEAP